MSGDSAVHDELRAVARDLLAADGLDWPLMVRAGWVGLEAPDAGGGAGASLAETAVILDEIGRAAAATPYLGGAVLTVGVLNALRAGETRDGLLGRVAAGDVRLAVALRTDGPTAPPFEFDGRRVCGTADFVPDAAGAEELLLLAADPDGAPLIVRARAEALRLTAQPVLDGTRNLARVTAAAEVDSASVLRFAGEPSAAVSGLYDRARLAVACDSLGLAEAMLAATVSYARVRHQFGRPIGSFQAVKHACADMLVATRLGRRLVDDAVNAVLAAGSDAGTAVLMAKAAVCDSAVDVVGKAMQLHGGIGYTWEGGVHTYLKRATLNRSLFGTPSAHRRQLAQRYL